MPIEEELKLWNEEVSIAFSGLSKTQAWVLALYSFGMICTGWCGQTIIVTFLGMVLGKKSGNLRQQLREWLYESCQKRGKKRQEVVVEQHFGELLRWVISQWRTPQQVVLGMDVTYVKDRWTILYISVLYHETAIPVAWKILRGNEKGSWNVHWQTLLMHLFPTLQPLKEVYVVCDRGMDSKTLFTFMAKHGCRVFMRIREQGKYRKLGRKRWQCLKQLAHRGMKAYAVRVECFKNDPLPCVLWVCWHAEYDEACLVVSNFLPRHTKGNPYPLRAWIETGFKQWKRGGFHSEQSKIVLPARLERLWLVMALAHVYLLRQGESYLATLTTPSDPAHRLSLVTLGRLRFLAFLLIHRALTEIAFLSYSLPAFFD